MYRIESLMLSSQLRAEINGHTDIFKIPSSLVCSTSSDFVEKIQINLCFY
jgi:hypothetical protein